MDDTTSEPEHRGPAPRATVVLRLVHHAAPGGGRPPRILRAGVLRVGRGAGDDGEVLADPRLSRVHFELEADAAASPRVLLRDRSSHGTFVNGAPVPSERELADGDVIRAGDSLFVVRWWPQELGDSRIPSILGDSPAIRALRADVALFGARETNVLITGETGTGKELVARALHAASGRRGPFVAVNSSAIPSELAESQLFGHVAGAFSGARAPHEGFFRAASGGTLFLDEVGDLPRVIQPKLLRAIEDRTVVPVGSSRPVASDVRLVAATNLGLEDAIANGSFRGDLYARLAEVRLRTPPLRERREDVLVLFLEALALPDAIVPANLAEALLVHAWPYNVRELGAVARELAIRSRGAPLDLEMVADRLPSLPAAGAEAVQLPAPSPAPAADERPVDAERFTSLARAHRGNVTALAQSLGRSRRQIHRYAEQFGVDLEMLRRE